MARIDELLSEYGESHETPANKLLHWICVPLIVFSLLGMAWSVVRPSFFELAPFPVNWAILLVLPAMIYYLVLSPALATGVLFLLLLMLGTLSFLAASGVMVGPISLLIFIMAWLGQFIGHKLEGKKPSFFKDLQFLLIGPLWLLAFLYRRLGIGY